MGQSRPPTTTKTTEHSCICRLRGNKHIPEPKASHKFRLETKPANTTTYGINGQILVNCSDSHKTEFTAQYIPHWTLIKETETLIVLLKTYDMVLGIPWLQDQQPKIDWVAGKILGLFGERGKVSRPANEENLGENQLQVELLTATAFADLITGSKVEYCALIEVSGGISLGATRMTGKPRRFLVVWKQAGHISRVSSCRKKKEQ